MIVASGQGGSKELSCGMARKRNSETHTISESQIDRHPMGGSHRMKSFQGGNGIVKKNLRLLCMLRWSIC